MRSNRCAPVVVRSRNCDMFFTLCDRVCGCVAGLMAPALPIVVAVAERRMREVNAMVQNKHIAPLYEGKRASGARVRPA